MTGLIPDDPRHGRYSTYTYHGCRCDDCRRANADAARRRRATSSRSRDTMRARSIAENRAATWIRANHPDVWERLLNEAYAEIGLERRPVGRNARRVTP